MELITKLSGLLKAITYTIRVALNPTPKTGCDSYNQDKNRKMILNGRKSSL